MLKSFLYLDSGRLRSISSQVFEGLTESVLRHSSESNSESETQKGPVGSGKVLADIFAIEVGSTELKFLEDHAYTLFEEEILERDLVRVVGGIREKEDAKFIKVTARLQFNDLAATSRILSRFNEIGEAFWRIGNQNFSNPSSGQPRLNDNEVRKRAAAANLQMDKKFIESASTLIDFGFDNLLEAVMIKDSQRYSAPLKRSYLRDSEGLILHKYSRYTQIPFTMLGMITQKHDLIPDDVPGDVKDADGVKEAMRTLSLHLRTLENVFSGPSFSETIIDPIAIYTEV